MKSTLIRSARLTDPGNLRGNNEDRVYADDDRGVYMVIDGVGGEAGGEEAAAIAEEEVVARLERSTGRIEDRIREGIALAGRRVLDRARRSPKLKGMSCVLTVVVVVDGEAVVGHVGDTRLYKIRRGVIEKITHDHSPVGVREDAGEISEQEAMHHPRRNEIFRDVGSEEHAPGDQDFVEIQRIVFEPDSALLLCSDGLTDQVSSAELLEAAQQYAGDPSRVARDLVRRANEAGGKDNVSIVYVEGPGVGSRSAKPATGIAASPAMLRRPIFPIALGVIAGLSFGIAATITAFHYRAENSPAGPRTLIVSPSQGKYATIAAGLEAAQPGDTVQVQPGTYHEQVEMKEGVRITGDAILEPRPDAAQPGAAIVVRNLRSGSLSGLRVSVPEASGVSVGIMIENSDVQIDGVEIRGASLAGIVIRGASRPVIRASYIHDNAGAGVVVEDTAAPRLLSNILASNAKSGMEISATANPDIRYNAFVNHAKALAWKDLPARETEVLQQNFVMGAARTLARPGAPRRGTSRDATPAR
jgi:serine/threonine protein phosphatase PrpC